MEEMGQDEDQRDLERKIAQASRVPRALEIQPRCSGCLHGSESCAASCSSIEKRRARERKSGRAPASYGHKMVGLTDETWSFGFRLNPRSVISPRADERLDLTTQLP